MNHAAHTSGLGASQRGAGSGKAVASFVVAAVLLLAAGVAFVPSERPELAAALARLPANAAWSPGGTDASVPPASSVFTGQHAGAGIDAPTF